MTEACAAETRLGVAPVVDRPWARPLTRRLPESQAMVATWGASKRLLTLSLGDCRAAKISKPTAVSTPHSSTRRTTPAMMARAVQAPACYQAPCWRECIMPGSADYSRHRGSGRNRPPTVSHLSSPGFSSPASSDWKKTQRGSAWRKNPPSDTCKMPISWAWVSRRREHRNRE
jgi:hypothetical protein